MSRGFTLIELMMVILVLTIIAGLAAVSLSSLRPPERSSLSATLQQARDSAVATGRRVIWREGAVVVWFESDGSSSGAVIGSADSAIEVDGLTGAAHAAR